MTPILVVSALVAIVVIGVVVRTRHRALARQRALSQLLDAADALEARLREARSEIEAIAGSDQNPVRAAMQDLLRQRLWLQENGMRAPLTQLQDVRATLEAARRRLDDQLQRVDDARAGAP